MRCTRSVAPLAGSVDRNNYANYAQALARMSLPSRGAWIEILIYSQMSLSLQCRSPRGERG